MSNAQILETLESRRLLAATLLGQTLFVRGTDPGDDTINITLNNAGDTIEVAVNGDPVQEFDKADVNLLVIRTWRGNDTISIENGVVGNAFIYSGAGNDTINAGDERDVIVADAGNDVINSGAGVAVVDAGTGADSVTTGSANDLVFAGFGNDTVTTDGGKDIITGDRGFDLIDSGSGNDRVYGGREDDTIAGGAGNDRLWGQGGNDNIDAGIGDDVLGGIVGDNTLIGGQGSDTFFVDSSLTGQTTDHNPNEDILNAVDETLADA